MDLNDTPEQAAYRAEARSWLEANKADAPARSGSTEDEDYVKARRLWQRRLAEAGLAAVTWPVEVGGRGLGPIEQVTVNQEISRAQVPGILDVIGIGMLGPCLIAHGTEEQKSRYLGPMLHGDEVWCQMFSEPGAGSDLAAVQTRAVRNEPDDSRAAQLDDSRAAQLDDSRAAQLDDSRAAQLDDSRAARDGEAGGRAGGRREGEAGGRAGGRREGEAGSRTGGTREDGWTLNGQKVWTTNAQFASFGLLLARTDPDIPKHKGLTMFIVPMDAPGVTVRGLRQISGEAEFNEVFFDDVRLAPDAVVGGVGNGWGTALTVLMYERLTIGFGSESYGSPARLAQTLAADPRACADADTRRRLGEVMTELLAVRFNGYRALTALSRGQIPGPEAGLAKVTMVNAGIAATDLAADVVGPDALERDNPWSYLISFLPGLKSAGGTEQILRNTIGERVLGLPPEPRLDKGVPFSELRAMEKQAVAR